MILHRLLERDKYTKDDIFLVTRFPLLSFFFRINFISVQFACVMIMIFHLGYTTYTYLHNYTRKTKNENYTSVLYPANQISQYVHYFVRRYLSLIFSATTPADSPKLVTKGQRWILTLLQRSISILISPFSNTRRWSRDKLDSVRSQRVNEEK